MHFLSTLITYRVFFSGGDFSIVGVTAYWRHSSTVVCDNIVFYNAGATKISNIDSGMAIVSTLVFYLLVALAGDNHDNQPRPMTPYIQRHISMIHPVIHSQHPPLPPLMLSPTSYYVSYHNSGSRGLGHLPSTRHEETQQFAY